MGSITLILPVLIALAVLIMVVRLGRDARVIRMLPPAAEAAQRAATRVQLRNRLALVSGLLASVATGIVALGFPADLGRAALLAPSVGATVAMLVFVLVPSAEFLESDTVRSADLAPRRAWDYARVWPAYAATALPVLLLPLLALGGNADGRSITHEYGDLAGATAGPYPGWFYATPLIVAGVVLAAATDVALRRVARAPRPSDPSLRDADATVRTVAVRLIVGVSAAAALGTLGVALLGAGMPTVSVAGGVTASIGGSDASIPAYAPLLALGIVEVVLGIAALGAGLALLLAATRLATRHAFRVGAAQ
jgi:hypothetical protein